MIMVADHKPDMNFTHTTQRSGGTFIHVGFTETRAHFLCVEYLG